jgi:colanic acid/amylovoran biosynthesis glycosyltransferase
MTDIVHLAGHIPHLDSRLVDHYRRADVFALASTSAGGEKEGVPGTVVEAMAAGLPIVATRRGGIPSVVADGEVGLLVDEGDVGALSAALQRLLEHQALRHRLGGEAARRAALGLDVTQAMATLEDIYDEIAGAGVSSGTGPL